MKHNKLNCALASLGIVSALVCVNQAVHASGFALVEQSVKQVGSAISAGAAADDASTIFFNPAGLTRLEGTHYSVAGHAVATSSKFSGAATFPGPLTVGGGNGGDAGDTAIVPNFYYARTLSNGVKFGLGINVPFGLTTNYDSDWTGRYHAVDSELMTVNINPSFAYKANEKLSLGAGLNAMYVDAKLSNAIDFSAVCIGQLGPATCAGLGLATPTNPATDGFVNIEGDDWAYGFNLGLLYEASPSTRYGVAYRSRVDVGVDATADFTVPAAALPLTGTGNFTDSAASAAVDLPETVSFNFYHDINPKWSIMGDLTWTRWSRFDQLVIQFDSPQPDAVTPENWNDTYKVSLGANYKKNSQWTWRGGLAFDETPIPSPEDRTPRIPGNDRTWLAVGFTYQSSPTFTVDFAFAHLIIDDTQINNTNSTAHTLTGEYEADVNILAAQLNWKF